MALHFAVGGKLCLIKTIGELNMRTTNQLGSIDIQDETLVINRIC